MKLDCIKDLALELDTILLECEEDNFQKKMPVHNFYRKALKKISDFEKEWKIDSFPIKDGQEIVLGASGEDLIKYDQSIRNYIKVVLNNVFKTSFSPFLEEDFDGDSLKKDPESHKAGRLNAPIVILPE